VIYPGRFRPSRSLRRILTQGEFRITTDRVFERVIQACAGPRKGQPGTWITRDMEKAYVGLYRQGIAHSVEAWHEGRLVGGLYGLALGRVFFGESMFSQRSNASKVAFASLMDTLTRWGFTLVDCQVSSPHLLSLGAVEIPRDLFVEKLRDAIGNVVAESRWRTGVDAAAEY
jgi:leucyl/phenylalanyl-tRNA--protein transferase